MRQAAGTFELLRVDWADKARWARVAGPYHKVVERARIGGKGSLFGFVWDAACGTNIHRSPWGIEVTADAPDEICKRCKDLSGLQHESLKSEG